VLGRLAAAGLVGLSGQVGKPAGRVGSAMADNFLACDRDQAFLLLPDLRDWLPADHLAGGRSEHVGQNTNLVSTA
jgi:hypothetical protein